MNATQPGNANGGAPKAKNGVLLRLALLAILIALTAFAFYRTGAWRFFVDRAEAKRFIDGLGMWGFAGFVLLQAAQVVAAPFP
ncbi:MAG TPA: hypothetical protein VIU29_03985, partial [Candidatus Deferrimicrobiaceae bacterium]